MRSRIARLVAWTSTAIVAAFLIPLCLLVATLAEDRAMASADQEAHNVALLVTSLAGDTARMASYVSAADGRGAGTTTVLLSDGTQIGTPSVGMGDDPEVTRALAGEAFSIKDNLGGRVYVPVVTDAGTAVVRTSVTPDQLHEGVVAAWVSIVLMGAALTAIALVVAGQAGKRVSEPLRAVAATAHELRGGDLSARANVSGPEETVELAAALNGLADRIGELLVAERATVGDLAHRLRTPVTALRLEAESVADAETAASLQGHLAELQRTIDAIVNEARRPLREDLALGCDAASLVRERLAFWEPLAEDQGRKLTVVVPDEPVRVTMRSLDLRDIVDILVDNVFAHTEEQVGFTVRLAVEGGAASLVVRDEGPGLPAADEPHEGRVGTTGLGLDIVRRTVDSAGGWVRTSGPGEPGATVEISLPLER